MSKDLDFYSGDASLRNKVFQRIKSQIIKGTYPAGETLHETNLADDLDISRTPGSEAFWMLEVEALVEISSK